MQEEFLNFTHVQYLGTEYKSKNLLRFSVPEGVVQSNNQPSIHQRFHGALQRAQVWG